MNGVTGQTRRVVIVGGGTAGWLAAALIAARRDPDASAPLDVTLVEAPDIPTVGVGEGSWPTLRRTLERIGIAEAEFLLACDASFKQGSRFDGWTTGAAGDSYLHPFTPPVEEDPRTLAAAWRVAGGERSFAEALCPQGAAALGQLAPRQRAMTGYAGALNYGYHLDAAAFARLLARHAVGRLGVRHVRDQVVAVEAAPDGRIAALATREHGTIAGDLFLDCSGHAAALIGAHFGVPFVDRAATLFNDRALAVHVPVSPESAIASFTHATAHRAGWLWDIALPTRRGVGCVYSSAHLGDDEAAAILRGHVVRTAPGVDPAALNPRSLRFRSGHRARFWEGNCIAVGLSAGFLEPLEASAIVLIELSVDALLDDFPATAEAMPARARRFNALFRYRWDRIVDFLKLHYVLSRRDEPYWREHRDAATVPDTLADLMALWRDRPPSRADLPMVDEVFPAASYQYVLYGMGRAAPDAGPISTSASADPAAILLGVERRQRTLAAGLPTNRAYLDALRRAAAPVAADFRSLP